MIGALSSKLGGTRCNTGIPLGIPRVLFGQFSRRDEGAQESYFSVQDSPYKVPCQYKHISTCSIYFFLYRRLRILCCSNLILTLGSYNWIRGIVVFFECEGTGRLKDASLI